MIELQAIAIDQTGGGMRAKQRDGEHLQQVAAHLKRRLDLAIEFWVQRREILVISSFCLESRIVFQHPT